MNRADCYPGFDLSVFLGFFEMGSESMNAMPDAQLMAAYRRARYCICVGPSEIVLHVDRYDRAAECRILSESPIKRRWSILTPCNPGSCALTTAQNMRRLDELIDILKQHHQPWLPTRNQDPDGCWPDEAGVLLCDPPTSLTESLARHFEQIAYLDGKIGSAPRLVWLTTHL